MEDGTGRLTRSISFNISSKSISSRDVTRQRFILWAVNDPIRSVLFFFLFVLHYTPLRRWANDTKPSVDIVQPQQLPNRAERTNERTSYRGSQASNAASISITGSNNSFCLCWRKTNVNLPTGLSDIKSVSIAPYTNLMIAILVATLKF